jgi:hypothetical protein
VLKNVGGDDEIERGISKRLVLKVLASNTVLRMTQGDFGKEMRRYIVLHSRASMSEAGPPGDDSWMYNSRQRGNRVPRG